MRWFNELPHREEFPQLGRLVEENRSDEAALVEEELRRAQSLIEKEHWLNGFLGDLLFIIKSRDEKTAFALTWDEDDEEEEGDEE